MPPKATTKKAPAKKKPAEDKLPEKLTSVEYRNAVARANAECRQEQSAAALEYREAVQPIASRRKGRSRAAVKARDARIRQLKDILAASLSRV